MKLRSVLLLLCAALTYAADQASGPAKAAPAPAGDRQPAVKKLGSVTWDPNAHKLQWTVETGSMVNGEFVSASKDQYEISPDDAVMGAAGEKRDLDNEEAAGLHQLLDILSLYCAQSVVWWDNGPDTPGGTPTGTDSTTPQKPVRVDQQSTPSKPAPPPVRIAPGMAVAHLQEIH